MKCAQERGHRDEWDLPLLSRNSRSGKEIHRDFISIECDVEKGVPDDLPAEPQEGCTTEGTLDLVVKGDLEFCRPSSGKCFAQQEEREAVNRKSQKSSRITRGGTEERGGQGQEIAALHFILEAAENQKRTSGLGVTESVSWEGYLRSSLGDALGWQWFQRAIETGGETR